MEVLAHFKFITIKDLKGPRRETEVVRARQIAMYELHTQRDDLSYPGIGRIFGNRDHTTVLHAVRKIQAMKEAGTPVYPVDGKIIK
nr:helix-turn-helix domain-containing protein [Rhizobium leguminosarum]